MLSSFKYVVLIVSTCLTTHSQTKSDEVKIMAGLQSQFCDCVTKESLKPDPTLNGIILNCDEKLLNSKNDLFFKAEKLLRTIYADTAMSAIDWRLSVNVFNNAVKTCAPVKKFTITDINKTITLFKNIKLNENKDQPDRFFLADYNAAKTGDLLLNNKPNELLTLFEKNSYYKSNEKALSALALSLQPGIKTHVMVLPGNTRGDGIRFITFVDEHKKPLAQIKVYYSPFSVYPKIQKIEIMKTENIQFDLSKIPPPPPPSWLKPQK